MIHILYVDNIYKGLTHHVCFSWWTLTCRLYLIHSYCIWKYIQRNDNKCR